MRAVLRQQGETEKLKLNSFETETEIEQIETEIETEHFSGLF